VELRTAFDSSRRSAFYSSGFEFLVPITWRGEIWHQRRREILEPGRVLAAHPGDVFASRRVLEAGRWSSLTIDADAIVKFGGIEGVAWERIRLRPFAPLSPALACHFQAVVQSIPSSSMDIVRVNLRRFLAVVVVDLGVAQKAPRDGARPAAVAAELGFVDQSHFRRHFKRLTGVTPASYVRDILPTPTTLEAKSQAGR